MPFFSCTVNEIGPAADGTETADPVIYVNLTDTGGSFVNQWFHARENSKGQMLSVGLAAMSTNRQVEVAVDTPNVPYSSVTRMYLLGPAPAAKTKAVYYQDYTPVTGGAQGIVLGPFDISPFAKIRIYVGVIGSGQVNFGLVSSGLSLDGFPLSAPGELTQTYDVPGVSLQISLNPVGGGTPQATIGLFGN